MPDDPDGRDDLDEPDDDRPTRAELEQLNTRFDDLAGALDDLRSSTTPSDKRDARGDVDDAEDAFTRAAKAAGLDRAAIVRAVQAAKDEQGYDAFKRMMDRYKAEHAAADDDKPPPKPKPRKRGGASPGERANGQPDEDTAPVRPHWSQRRLSDLLQ